MNSNLMRQFWINLFALCFALFFTLFAALYAEASADYNINDLFRLSLAEIMNISVKSGNLTSIPASKVPIARTVITAEDIAVTPARSIMDLLEVYVPGASFVNHHNGSRFGFRGILGDQNFHYLLLVNGRNMNLKAEDGPFAEIFNRDLSDIQKIEIIRGPGTVTYGPGAIGGVINIITHDAKSCDGFKIGGELNQRYRYQNIHASYGKEEDSGLAYYFSGSYSHSDGNENTKLYYVDREHGYGYGYMSESWGNMNTGSAVTNYYGDALNKPQVKLHAGFDYNDWGAWMRYTSGSIYNMQQEIHSKDKNDFPSQEWDVFTVEVENNYACTDKLNLQTKVGFDSFSYRQIAGLKGDTTPRKNILQYCNNYSENEYNIHSVLSYAHNNKFKYAAGLAYSYEYYAPRWGENDDKFLMAMRAPLDFTTITESSAFYKEYGSEIVSCINAPDIGTYSAFIEANMAFHKYTELLLSGRADKNELSTWAYSQRIALVTEITNYDIVKTIWQKSVRTPNMVELYVADYENVSPPKHEKLESYEIIFGHTKENFSCNFNLYYNILDELQWISTKNTSDITGQLKMWGFEAEILFQTDSWRLGGNYSYIRQNSWKWIEPMVIPTQNLSDDAGGSLTIPEYADNRINNFPGNTIKIFWNKKWINRFSTHVNTRCSWKQNQKELLKEYLNAHNADGTAETRAEMRNIYDALTDHGYGQASFTINASGTWQLPLKNNPALTLYAMNLISHNNIRYNIQYYENITEEYSRQCSFIDEPVSLGIKLEIEF